VNGTGSITSPGHLLTLQGVPIQLEAAVTRRWKLRQKVVHPLRPEVFAAAFGLVAEDARCGALRIGRRPSHRKTNGLAMNMADRPSEDEKRDEEAFNASSASW
jgi:hypothetical protein